MVSFELLNYILLNLFFYKKKQNKELNNPRKNWKSKTKLVE